MDIRNPMIMTNTQNTPFFKIDRQRLVLSLLKKEKRLSLADLESRIGASRITVQRDLAEMEARGLLKRFHGGAMVMDYDLDSVNHERRIQVNPQIKLKLCRKAVSLIKANMFIAVDASSTTYFMSECMLPAGVKIVTAGIDTFLNLQNTGHTPILTGGRYHALTRTLVGPEAVSVIRQFTFDYFFFSVFSFADGHGLFDAHAEDASVKHAFIEQSRKSVLLIDASKVSDKGGAKVCDVSDVDRVIMDKRAKDGLKKVFRNRLIYV